ncbi:MAG: formate dehydrogenase accessory sulfurtransferase FdhD [bacterium]
MSKKPFYSMVGIVHYQDKLKKKEERLIVNEFPLTIYLNKDEIITLLCTGDYLEYLALGFLSNEGLILSKDGIKEITIDKNAIFIETKEDILKGWTKRRSITSGCGKGGSFYDVLEEFDSKKIESNLVISPIEILYLMDKLEERSILYKETHGVHNSALCTTSDIIVFHQDIGRHNTIDKISGQCLLENIDKNDKLVVTSGRISSEIVIKLGKMNISILVSMAAPTDLAVSIAEKINLTLIANVRGRGMEVYTHPFRIQ